MEPPEESWTNIPVIKVIAKDSSYEEAKVKLKDAEILTNFEEDSDIREDKLKRSRKKRARISTSSCNEEEFDGKEVQLDPFPHPPQTINSKNNSFINSYKAKKENAVLKKNGNQCLAVNDATQITNDIPVFSKSLCTSQSMPAKRSLNVFQRFVMRTLTNIKFDIQNLQREVKAIKKESFAALNRKFENDQLEEEKKNVLINLPLKTTDGDLRELEENLTNKEYRNQAIKELQQIGGKTLKKYVFTVNA
ncbi:uncharacterized protein LOC116846695 [Odontomachus brunneus]|uniref:uncharacterized protein LOC116846695 n=1 Tax=Odontomachus brunneus TaxID=486640 RepID=UPI0013F286AA|nr:uncharacterized protein LOC116846695 [Odontomachus brunneus]